MWSESTNAFLHKKHSKGCEMNEYDFSNLNPSEFETLANDLLSNLYKLHIERFKQGKDQGIDGRFFCIKGKEVTIIQSKHYIASGFTKLLSDLINIELDKVKKISPNAYIVVTSVPLSPQNKEKIKEAMTPYVTSSKYIFGKEDVNALLRMFPSVERAHYKLWISSSEVLMRFLNAKIYNVSQNVIADAYENSAHYVVTNSHLQAKTKIEKSNVLVITGAPGVGKTTLAEQLCLEYIADGYDFFAITKDIDEGFEVLSSCSKQLFYFDDFLGKNFIETLRFNEDSRIMRFANIVTKSNAKKFILTSRTNILDQGYRVGPSFNDKKIKNKEYIIDISNYDSTDKAKILYSFLWKSDIEKEFLELIINNKEYLKIINHRNYNPRLLEFITSNDNVSSVSSGSYLQFINESLSNPREIWKDSYNFQLCHSSRAIVDLIVFGNGYISDESLRKAYHKFINNSVYYGMTNIARDFDSIMSILSRSFIKKTCILCAENGPKQNNIIEDVMFSPFNPSISDYIISRYSQDYFHIADIILLYEGDEGVDFLETSVLHNRDMVRHVAQIIFDKNNDNICFLKSLNAFRLGNFLNDTSFSNIFINISIMDVAKSISETDFFCESLLNFCSRLLYLHINDYKEEDIENLIIAILECGMKYYELVEMSSFLEAHMQQHSSDKIVKQYYDKLLDAWKYEKLEEFATDNIYKFAEESYGEYDDYCDHSFVIDEDKLASLIAEETADLYTPIEPSDAKHIMSYIDLEEIVSNHYRQHPDDERSDSRYSSGDKDIDGLFDGFLAAKFG